jgi:antitoxin component of MazEF toxin-antitoxin module
MTRTLTKTGDLYSLVIDRPMMDLLNIQPETPLDVTTEDGRIVITPARIDDANKQKIREAADWVNKNYSNALKKLAE